MRAAVRVRPRSPLRLAGATADGTARAVPGGVRRLVHLGGEPVVLQAVGHPDGTIELAAEAATAAAAEAGLDRVRFWTGVDEDLTPFLERFAGDPLIGRSVRRAPWLRPYRRPLPWEMVLGAICEQLVTEERAIRIRRRVVDAFGARHGGLVDVPAAEVVAALAPAQLERCGLTGSRAATLISAAREVAAGRVDLLDPARGADGLRRLRRLDGIGSWTVAMVALHALGEWDALPAGDHAYRVLVAQHLRGRGAPKAGEAEVMAFFERYAPWRGLTGWHLVRAARR